MNAVSSTERSYQKKGIDLKGAAFRQLLQSADAFICAAGFEARGERAPMAANVNQNPVIIAFRNGPAQNDKTFTKFATRFRKVPGYDVCELDLAHAERFEADFERTLHRLRNLATGHIILDISALPNFAICVAVMKIRQTFPTFRTTLLYTEAEDYFPQKRDFERIKRMASKRGSDLFPEYLSASAVNLYMPSMFSGLALGHNDTCLMVFAGYEPHRTACVIEATNPSKLVMIYGEPERSDLKWRLELSRLMHTGINEQLTRTEEVSSTSSVSDNLELLLRYYEYLYDDHVICVCPTNSKMQAIASALAWEIYPDIQLNFPVPVEYLPKKFSVEYRTTFVIDLGFPPQAKRFLS